METTSSEAQTSQPDFQGAHPYGACRRCHYWDAVRQKGKTGYCTFLLITTTADFVCAKFQEKKNDDDSGQTS